MTAENEKRLSAEERFHDQWASGVDVSTVDVIGANEALTAPEMRYIIRNLGDLKGKRVLDVGCGLGEAGVYFALKGAEVTVTDLSEAMLEAAATLAKLHGVQIHLHKGTAECIRLPDDHKFDVIYVGNLFHHVDIAATLKQLQRALKADGTLVSWDPVAYNPVINVYRRIATVVRTEGEHPLRVSDIKLFKKHFRCVRVRYFWFTTLIIFMLMAVVQRRNPNAERYWKKVVEEADQWAFIYRPLEALDAVLLRIFPFLGLLCWNVVIHASGPLKSE